MEAPIDPEHPAKPLLVNQRRRLLEADLALKHPVLQDTYDADGLYCHLDLFVIYFLDPRQPTTKVWVAKPVFQRLVLLFPGFVRELRAELADGREQYLSLPRRCDQALLKQLHTASLLMARLVDADDPRVKRPDITNPGTMLLDTIHIYR